MHEPQRHVPLCADPWDAGRARQAIADIVDDALTAFDPQRFWLAHEHDGGPDGAPALYGGAAGAIWAIDHLRRIGATDRAHDFARSLPTLASAQRAAAATYGAEARYASLLMSEVPVLLLQLRLAPDRAVADRLYARLRDNDALPVLDLMWGTAGSMLAARFAAELTGDARWHALFRAQARRLLGELRDGELRDGEAGPVWLQELYGNPPTCLYGLVHGLAGNLAALLRGWDQLDDAQHDRVRAAAGVLVAVAHEDVEGVNWPVGNARWPVRGGVVEPVLLQQCHGAPGVITGVACFPAPWPALDRVLVRAGELIWHAGPLAKGANICHGTAGSGYALLALFARTGDPRWLARARAFAMTAIAQVEAARDRYSQGRYTLWTGDLGTAVFLWDCITGEPRFPTLDVF